MSDSRLPIKINSKVEVLPPIEQKKPLRAPPFAKTAALIDISPVNKYPKSVSALQKTIHMLFPSCSEYELTVKNGRLFLGSKRVGTLSEEKEIRGKMRIWIDELVKSGAIAELHDQDEFPKDLRRLSAILPISALLGVVFTDAHTLIRAIESSKYAALVSEGYDEVRLEFHNSKRAKPTDSFLLDSHFLETTSPNSSKR